MFALKCIVFKSFALSSLDCECWKAKTLTILTRLQQNIWINLHCERLCSSPSAQPEEQPFNREAPRRNGSGTEKSRDKTSNKFHQEKAGSSALRACTQHEVINVGDPAHSRKVETRWSLWSVSTQAMIWFYEIGAFWEHVCISGLVTLRLRNASCWWLACPKECDTLN